MIVSFDIIKGINYFLKNYIIQNVVEKNHSLLVNEIGQVYELKLANSNELVKNSKAIDLQDLTNSIAVQVISTPRKSKIQETLDKFFESNLDKDFQTLL